MKMLPWWKEECRAGDCSCGYILNFKYLLRLKIKAHSTFQIKRDVVYFCHIWRCAHDERKSAGPVIAAAALDWRAWWMDWRVVLPIANCTMRHYGCISANALPTHCTKVALHLYSMISSTWYFIELKLHCVAANCTSNALRYDFHWIAPNGWTIHCYTMIAHPTHCCQVHTQRNWI